MSKKQKITVALMVLGVIVCSAKNITSSELINLRTQPASVVWLKPQKTADSGRKVYHASHFSEKAMKRASGKLLYAIENYPESDNLPAYYMALCHNLTELEEDRVVIYWLNKLLHHPDLEKFAIRGHWMTEIKNPKLKVQYMLLKVYARNKLEQEALALIQQLQPKIPKEFLTLAEAYAVMGMKSKALKALEHCVTSGEHIKYQGTSSGSMNPGWVMNQSAVTRASAAVLAFGLGDLALAKRIAEPVINDNELKNHKWSSRRVSWIVLNDIYHAKSVISLEGLKDGFYKGKSQGYADEIEATIEVKNGKIAKINLTYQSESRPYNALSAIPARIMKGTEPVVDAVSGATVSSTALCMAVYNALLKN